MPSARRTHSAPFERSKGGPPAQRPGLTVRVASPPLGSFWGPRGGSGPTPGEWAEDLHATLARPLCAGVLLHVAGVRGLVGGWVPSGATSSIWLGGRVACRGRAWGPTRRRGAGEAWGAARPSRLHARSTPRASGRSSPGPPAAPRPSGGRRLPSTCPQAEDRARPRARPHSSEARALTE